jgi:hypothetical protein
VFNGLLDWRIEMDMRNMKNYECPAGHKSVGK